ncbi:XdhC/CoxI family protein [Clostridium sp. MB40-C1]|uniref:XdhC family protein n=1 Tax=Clostridium sp. MB40-C1 TaxID=3070996 RepID=UPI0027E0CBBB|nr:XdhC/CoxI family protein [Clostridium sp. MB40-C1]WMJ79754.1 XdhC/CoxI family protein [Clostridium sp. MB40-C1]
MIDMYEEIYKMKESGQEGVVVTVVQRKGHGPANVGKKLLVYSNGDKKGTVGGGELEYLAIEKAKEIMNTKKHCMQSYDFTGKIPTKDVISVDMICGGLVTLYFEYIPVNPRIYILGAGHVGKCLADVLVNLDYKTIVIDDREEIAEGISKDHEIVVGDYEKEIDNLDIPDGSYIVITGYTHEIDYKILKAVCSKECKPKYIGMLSSKNKASFMIDKLKGELNKELDLSMLHAPIGLDLGGDTPEEIAISILSEIQAIRYGKEGNKHMTEKWI